MNQPQVNALTSVRTHTCFTHARGAFRKDSADVLNSEMWPQIDTTHTHADEAMPGGITQTNPN